MSDRALPPPLDELHELPFDYAADEIDFEPFAELEAADATTAWLRAWTRNPDADGAAYRVFGSDGTGGRAALWLARAGRPLVEQPIVFFGSEGELGPVARDVADYLWLLAGGVGPYEAIAYPDETRAPNAKFTAFAARHAPAARKSARQVIDAARAEFPDFARDVRTLTR